MLLLNGTEYLSEKEVSKRYGLSTHWFRKARYEGNSPVYHKLNEKVYYTTEHVDQWLRDNLKPVL